ncbi:MAG TPA: GIY-YIG nuclease family protein [Anaerolineae bacterium]|nr:GIY-YIG nuclease family protein [Anaerolineae bacterium]
MSFYVYIVECADGTFYTGWTTDLARRVVQHNAGRGARYTRQRRPVQLVYWEEQPNRSAAMHREHALKQWSRPRKQRLIASEHIEKPAPKPLLRPVSAPKDECECILLK